MSLKAKKETEAGLCCHELLACFMRWATVSPWAWNKQEGNSSQRDTVPDSQNNRPFVAFQLNHDIQWSRSKGSCTTYPLCDQKADSPDGFVCWSNSCKQEGSACKCMQDKGHIHAFLGLERAPGPGAVLEQGWRCCVAAGICRRDSCWVKEDSSWELWGSSLQCAAYGTWQHNLTASFKHLVFTVVEERVVGEGSTKQMSGTLGQYQRGPGYHMFHGAPQSNAEKHGLPTHGKPGSQAVKLLWECPDRSWIRFLCKAW